MSYIVTVFSLCSVLKRTMRDWAVPLPGQVRWLRLGSDPGHCHQRQAAEACQCRLRQLHHQVGLGLGYL